MSYQHAYFASCPKGLESLLLSELNQLGAAECRETVGGIYFSGDLALAYRCCLWSRLANRILLILAVEECRNLDDYYRAVKAIDWRQHLNLNSTFAIDFSGSMHDIKHSHFGALKAKDAIADYFTEREGRRPNIDANQPDIWVNVRINKGKVTIALDLSGESLHRRGYRFEGGAAPLKENLAAAILLRADWPAVAAQGGALVDPLCGSGTLLIEAALMAANIAPGLLRSYWGFSGWLGHDDKLWQAQLAEAEQIKKSSLSRQWPLICGFDHSPKAINIAKDNLRRAGLAGKVTWQVQALSALQAPEGASRGLVLTNPPYGERLGEVDELKGLYRLLGDGLKAGFQGWQAAVFTGNPDLGKTMGLRSHKQYQFYNGPIASKLLLFKVEEAAFVNTQREARTIAPAATGPVALSEGAKMFANRIKKNRKQLAKWSQQQGISCYRLYDADMPEYAVAVDMYEQQVHVSEYVAPAKVSEEAAQERLNDVMAALPDALNVSPEQIFLKQRRRQKGKQQYEKFNSEKRYDEVREGQAKLLVNLSDYLDTGLFLDHRPVRLYIAQNAKNKRFLNLFCYTATASVHAAIGGAASTDSVDLSNTYLDWGRKNLTLNGCSEAKHQLHRADVREWLASNTQQFDLILLDPPTFSNSKKMAGTFDIQRDQQEFIDAVMPHLAEGGLLIFSNNHRRFVLDDAISEHYAVEDKSSWSLDKDFQRNKKIHQCWFIRHKA